MAEPWVDGPVYCGLKGRVMFALKMTRPFRP